MLRSAPSCVPSNQGQPEANSLRFRPGRGLYRSSVLLGNRPTGTWGFPIKVCTGTYPKQEQTFDQVNHIRHVTVSFK